MVLAPARGKPKLGHVCTSYAPVSGHPQNRAWPSAVNRSAMQSRPRLLIFVVLLLACASVFAQQQSPAVNGEIADCTEVLPKTSQNTVASVMSVPVENKTNFGMGPYERNQNILSVKPLIPMQLSKGWRLIARIIQPVQWQPYLSQTQGGKFGVGDMNPTFFFSPAPPKALTWGTGPTFIVPTATNRLLGQGKFSIGPEFALFVQPGHWTYGILISNVWSVAGSAARSNINQMQLQYFVTHQLTKSWEIATSPVIAANWNASSGDIWTVPVGGGLGKIIYLGSRPAKISAQFYRDAVRPSGAPAWSMRLQTEFLFATRK